MRYRITISIASWLVAMAACGLPAQAARHGAAQAGVTFSQPVDAAAAAPYPLEAKQALHRHPVRGTRATGRPRAVAGRPRRLPERHPPAKAPRLTEPGAVVASADPDLTPTVAPSAGVKADYLGEYEGFADGMAAPMPKIVRVRPYRIAGIVDVAGKQFGFVTGGWRRGSMPYGDFPITPDEVGPWGSAHGAIGLNDNSMWDPQLNDSREGVEMHAGDDGASAGCFVIASHDWRAFKSAVFGMIDKFGQAFLHFSAAGAAITATKTSPLPPVIYIAERHQEIEASPRRRVRVAAHHHRHRYARL